MANTSDTIGTITSEIASGLEPIENAFSSLDRFQLFLKTLGWNGDSIAAVPAGILQLVQGINGLSQILQEIISKTEDGETISPEKIQELIISVKKITEGINDLKNIVGLPAALVNANFLQIFPRQLFDYLLANYLLQHQPKIGHLLAVLGLIRIQYEKGTGVRNDHFSYTIAFEDLPQLINNPTALFQNAYQWGTDDFDPSMLFIHLQNLFLAYGTHLTIENIPVEKLGGFSIPNDPEIVSPQSLKAAIFDYTEGSLALKAGLGIFQLGKAGSSKPGLVLLPFAKGDFKVEKEVAENLFFQTITTIDIEGGVGIGWRPNEGLKTVLGFDSAGSPSEVRGELKLALINKDQSGEPILLFGSKTGSNITYGSLAIIGGVQLHTQADAVLFIETELKNAKILIKAGEGDGFLQKILPAEGISANFDIAVGLSTQTGLYFRGSAGLEISLPTHLSLGPVELQSITIAIKIEPNVIPVDVGITVIANLGPLQVVVENIGITANFAIKPDASGNLGMLDLSLGFKPPNGLGLSINTGAVTGGGYLFFDFEKQEYAGTLELTIVNLISAKAIGLLTTKMPDGSKGFSLLVIITAEFFPPFQLGYGFTLNGVGGLIGLNRTVLLEPLRNGVRTGAVNNIMFPQNVIANAPRIISDLKAIFPPFEQHFLIGPMGKMGWGTPSLITLSLGLIIEIPGNIAILGVLRIALPEESIALINIQVNFVGTLDFDKKMLSFDASLYDSRILFMTLEGDLAVRLKWGDDPDFILTVGGFHPSYKPPPLALPTLRRLAINIINTDLARIRIECYQAVTSNTVQFGAKAEMFLGFSSLSVEGHISFDALFQFSPFTFTIDFSASFSLKAFGIGVYSVRVRGSLQGPTPWRAKGSGGISFFFFDIDVDFDKTWGESKDTSLPAIEILPRLLAELEKREQWHAYVPSGNNLQVSLRKLSEAVDVLVLHPAGSLTVQQKILPLDLDIDKIGNQKTNDVKRIAITKAKSAGVELSLFAVNDFFARAQYQDMSDAEKLSKPSFEKLHGGVNITMSDRDVNTSKMARKIVEYEVIIIDKELQKPLKRGLFFKQIGGLFLHFLKGSAVTKSSFSKATKNKLQPFAEKIKMREDSYAVAFIDNNKLIHTDAVFESEAMATDYMKQQDTVVKEKIHVISGYELN